VFFVLLDYGSTDGLLDYVKENHARDIDSGKLRVFTYPDAGKFKMAHAKNMADSQQTRLSILVIRSALLNI